MVARPTRLAPEARSTDGLEAVFAAIRAEHEVPEDFPAPVLAAAEEAARAPRLPAEDATDVPFVTIDPPGARDLDQALHVERRAKGYLVRYAIADLTAFLAPGDPVDLESHRRGQTVYCPDARAPLHPPVLSEGAASLLPGEVRPAYVWEIVLDADGARSSAHVRRALVRSRRQLSYAEAQAAIEAGEETALLLEEVGRLRVARESARGGASLPKPEQEVHLDDEGRYALRLRPLVPAEEWNAQVSLLTGIAAAQVMLEGGTGLLRTMPPAEPEAVARFRREVAALGATWPEDQPYGDFLRSLDRTDPRHLAVVHEAASLFRGSAYTVLDADHPAPADPRQAAIAAPYAHTTAPLRRLVDRYALATCEALCAGREVPDWVTAALPGLPATMESSARRAGAVERACTDAVEAAVLAHRVGEVFEAVVVDVTRSGPELLLLEPAVTARAEGEAEAGTRVRARLVEADLARRSVRFAVLPEQRSGSTGTPRV